MHIKKRGYNVIYDEIMIVKTNRIRIKFVIFFLITFKLERY